jgi:glutamyl/glutaminyl-tRNA synthetase
MATYTYSTGSTRSSTAIGFGAAPPLKKRYNTRIAPSPTGHAHIGTFRTAYFCYLAARATGGRFMLRIDDTDTNRNDEKAVGPIHEALEWLEMYPDQTVRQSDFSEGYYHIAKDLVNSNLAIVLANGAIALKWHPEMPTEWHDNIAGKMAINATNIQQIDGKLILCKGKEGKYAPTYQLASTYDDHRFDINYIIRGTDHISNTPKQMALWWALNKIIEPQEYPEWAHVGLIFKDGKKLSKRDGAASVLEWRDKGYTPHALKSFMLRLGWAPKIDNKENDLLDLDRAIQMFLTEGKMRNSSANMDVAKLDAYERKTRALYGKATCTAIDRITARVKANHSEEGKLNLDGLLEDQIDLDENDNDDGGMVVEAQEIEQDPLYHTGYMFISRMKKKTRKKIQPAAQRGWQEVNWAPPRVPQALQLRPARNVPEPADLIEGQMVPLQEAVHNQLNEMAGIQQYVHDPILRRDREPEQEPDAIPERNVAAQEGDE